MEYLLRELWRSGRGRAFLIICGVTGVLIISFCIREVHRRAEKVARLSHLTAALQPIVVALRHEIQSPSPSGSHTRLSRPYVFFHLDSGSNYTLLSDDQGVMPGTDSNLTIANIKTVILVRYGQIEQRRYTDTVNNGPPGQPFTLYRYGYDMWAFDVKTGSLGAYKRLEDEPFRSSYSSGDAHVRVVPGPGGRAIAVETDMYGSVMSSDLRRWADSITDASSTLEQPLTGQQPPTGQQPLTGRQALQEMYDAARRSDPSVRPIRVNSILLPEVRAEPGSAAAWQAIFVSAGQSAAIYTDSIADWEGILHKGVFPRLHQSWSGSPGASKPFPVAAIKIDSDQAYQTALRKGAEYDKKNPGKPINLILEDNNKFSDASWRVMWGETAGTSNFSIYVDASTGAYLETMH